LVVCGLLCVLCCWGVCCVGLCWVVYVGLFRCVFGCFLFGSGDWFSGLGGCRFLWFGVGVW
jgi:hypothetical protein